MKSRAGIGSVKMTAWLATVLCCWDWALADGAPPTFRINTSEYDFAHAIGRPGKSEEEAAEGPRLLSRSWQRLVVSRGSSITLNCSVADPGDVSVTWTRNKEVLTVDRYRFSSDTRLSPLHEPGSRDYNLRFSNVTPADSAVYQCHVGTRPEQIARVKLSVIDAYSVIFGSSEVAVPRGGTLYLLCMVLQVSDIPEYIIWYRNSTILEYNRMTISVVTEEETRSSELRVRNMTFADAGRYTCQPSNASPAHVQVEVVRDTKNKSGKAQKCDDCVLFLQLGATFAFFTISFIVAFCVHGRRRDPCPDRHLSQDRYVPPDIDKNL
ncbi:fibroblast growth factor receptor 3 isoform X2 [Penaeus vannamei]|uniref:fibroblast growth factor receptor 3 isoform X2 n=1 Tax=Penaeus vannamei TaxID=6689 RepID=UPI00387F6C4A